MHLYELPLVFVLIGLVFYVVLAGADFGAGFWQLFAGRGDAGVIGRGASRGFCVCSSRPSACSPSASRCSRGRRS